MGWERVKRNSWPGFYCLFLSISNKIKIIAIKKQVLANIKKTLASIPPAIRTGVKANLEIKPIIKLNPPMTMAI